MIEHALQQAGGVDYLVAQAKENAPAFLHLIGKILPRDVNVQTTQRVYVVAPEVASTMEEWSQRVQAAPDDVRHVN